MENSPEEDLSKLLQNAQEGNKNDYQIFLKKVYDKLNSYVSKRIYVQSEIEDVLQEILIAVHLSLHTFNAKSTVEPWLYAIANHKIIDFIRKYSKKSDFESPIQNDIEAYTIMIPENEEKLNIMISLIEKLPNKQRIVVKLLKFERIPISKISKLLGMSESSVKVTAHRAYKKLKDMVKNND